MIKGIYKTASSMVPRVRKQEVIAHNIANTETAGYKKDSIFLRYVKDQQKTLGKLATSWDTKMIDKVYTDFSGGSLEATGRDLDLALQGDGFFVVQTPNGEAYSRDGALTISTSGQLVNSDNMPILTDGGPVTVTGSKITIGINGQITMDGIPVGALRIVNFENPDQLKKVSGSLYKAPSGVSPIAVTNTMVRQGYLEKSNVDVLREMVEMIESYRAFETGQKMIQIQDESLGKAVNELGRKG